MYYESRQHQAMPLKSFLEAAKIIKSQSEPVHKALCVSVMPTGTNCYLVADFPHSWGETAVILEQDGVFTQIESITDAWINSPEELAKYFEDAVNEPCMKSKANLTIGSFPSGKIATFTCGCCGSSFKSVASYQAQFGQDSSYGICKGCEKYYK